MVMPGMVYISQPTEYGTLYTLEELTELSMYATETTFLFIWMGPVWLMH